MTEEPKRSKQRSLRGPRALLGGTAIAVVLLWVPAATAAVAAASPADTAATHAYLQARFALYDALVRGLPAARAGTIAAGERLDQECPGVLAGEPQEEGPLLPLPNSKPPSARERGERARSERQQLTISAEIFGAVNAVREQLERAPVESYARAVGSLSWSNARIVPLLQASTTALQESLDVAPPSVCADMKAWAQSGFRLLSPASRAYQAMIIQRSEQAEPKGSISALLKPYEGAPERALIRRTDVLRKRLASTELHEIRSTYPRVGRGLGIPASPGEERNSAPVLGSGKTRSGATFKVRPEPGESSQHGICRHPLTVEMNKNSSSEGISSVSFGSSGDVCLTRTGDRFISRECGDDEISVVVAVPARVRTVRLQLSNGATVTSRVIEISRKHGGPGGVYVQGLRGHKPYPVSLTELDGSGRVVQTLPVRGGQCKQAPRRIPSKFVALARGELPDGQTFAIEGALETIPRRPRVFSLYATVNGQGFGPAADDESESDAVVITGVRKTFKWSEKMGCPPRSFALVYGILAAPGDSVLARTPEGLVPLTKQDLSPSLRADGRLVYGVFAAPPSELIVRGADGSTLATESLAAKTNEDREFCEGAAEG